MDTLFGTECPHNKIFQVSLYDKDHNYVSVWIMQVSLFLTSDYQVSL